ncbi:hypothetical protein DENSPDRAFT_854307 [Dentipellis sp. KUC8613]|nr:hypothetical protein DENSPDRAFT_854307 [Dentipellis sp. KUC8613]
MNIFDANIDTLRTVSLYGIFVVMFAWEEDTVEGVAPTTDPVVEAQPGQDHEHTSAGDSVFYYADIPEGGSISGKNSNPSVDDGPSSSHASAGDNPDTIHSRYSTGTGSPHHQENVADSTAKAGSSISDSGYESGHAITLTGAESEDLPEVEELRLGFWHAQELVYILKQFHKTLTSRCANCGGKTTRCRWASSKS